MDRIDGYVFTELEFLCLASLVGMNRIYGYDYSKNESLKKDIHYAIYGLAKKGCIRVTKKNDVEISEELINIFNILKRAHRVFDVYCYETMQRLIIYKGQEKEAVFIRPNSTKHSEVIVGIILNNYIVRYLLDEGYIKYTIKDDLGEGREINRNGDIRKDTKEDRVLCIKKFNKEYNIDKLCKMEVYESYIYDDSHKNALELTYHNLHKIFL